MCPVQTARSLDSPACMVKENRSCEQSQLPSGCANTVSIAVGLSITSLYCVSVKSICQECQVNMLGCRTWFRSRFKTVIHCDDALNQYLHYQVAAHSVKCGSSLSLRLTEFKALRQAPGTIAALALGVPVVFGKSGARLHACLSVLACATCVRVDCLVACGLSSDLSHPNEFHWQSKCTSVGCW